ncbi:glycosyl hydrolase 5 family protein-like [Impatiens glandulifera]|uniref:glycosyl hydrolase 5 family protein-like n=1 Tax=Impatiens glandulifera TaxID=253017 RepID=UPI001FB0E27B|nr:glycosyl hydrolase 5 family protein-like [Impatiens glandulifera]
MAITLSTNSRWIVDPSGNRFKLRCTNWAGHLHIMVPEGLEKQPLSHIAANVASMGFNCVRLLWATFMYTRHEYSSLTVAQSLDKFDLKDAKEGFAINNPKLLNLTGENVHLAVVNELGLNNVVVILDNHISLPQWCCGETDGNGFFGDENFDVTEWGMGLTMVARKYKGNPTVVGMSMRNELRGSRQNENDWYDYMQQGANAIHYVNPDMLIIVSGLQYNSNLEFLKGRPFGANVDKKLVFEAHWYPFGESQESWLNKTNEFCGSKIGLFFSKSGFLLDNGIPLFLSEFGTDQRGGDEMGNRYLNCLISVLAEKDLDWGWWALQGSYMLREGVTNMEESYGMMDLNWTRPRNITVQRKLQFLQQISQDPNSNKTKSNILYHPQSGQCVNLLDKDVIALGNCNSSISTRWDQDQDGSAIKLAGTDRCLSIVEEGEAVGISGDCGSPRAKWRKVSGSGLHLAGKREEGGGDLCLDGSSSMVFTNKCLCVGSDSLDLPFCDQDPQIQWFKLVPINVY